MADTKLSDLNELATTPAAADEFYIRDVSEVAAAESKRITRANLVGGLSALTVAQTEVYSAAAPTTWTDLDLSGTIGSQVTVVILKLTSAYGYRTVAFRKNGDTEERFQVNRQSGLSVVDLAVAGVACTVLVLSDASGVIEWKAEMADTTTIDVIAYIK
tara:strand:+ start:1503 stop:1979 length:477 start_codon:yes stop_codon:yes gene_type:complete